MERENAGDFIFKLNYCHDYYCIFHSKCDNSFLKFFYICLIRMRLFLLMVDITKRGFKN